MSGHFILPSHNKQQGTNLVSLDIDSLAVAHEVIGMKPEGLTPLILCPSRGCCSAYMNIPEGFVAMVTRWGRYIGKWEPGLHFAPPWYGVAYLVTQADTVFDCPVKNCKTKDNVDVSIDVVLVFRITEAENFVYKLGAEKLEDLLRASQEEAVRSLARSQKYVKVYELQGMNTDEMLQGLNAKLDSYGVEVTSVTITSVRLTPEVAAAMQNETTFESKQNEEAKSQEFNLRVLGDKEDFEKLKEKRHFERLDEEQTIKTRLAEVDKETAMIVAEGDKQIAEIVSQEQADIARIKEEQDLVVAQLSGQAAKALAENTAQGEKLSAKINADAEAYFTTCMAAARLQVAQLEAEKTELISDAAGKSAPKLAAKREHVEQMLKAETIGKLASNKNVVVSGSSGDNMLAQLAAAQSGAIVMGVDPFKNSGGRA